MPAFTNRFEIKYLVETARLPEIRDSLGGYFDCDANGDSDGTYVNYSIYFDSPDYRFYTEKREGNLVRIKPRIRLYRPYDDAPPTGIYLELKGRHDRVVNKRRVAIEADLAERLLRGETAELSKRELESSVMSEFHYLCHKYALRPCVTVVYYRTAFNGRFQHDLRMTFDRVFRCSLATDTDIPASSLIDAFSPTSSIIELKYNNQISGMLLHRLRNLGLKQQTLSKFGIAMETTYDHLRRNPGMRQRTVLRHETAKEIPYVHLGQRITAP